VLAEWGLAAFTDVVTLIISEMTTNAIAATRKVAWEGGLPPVRLWLLGGAGAQAAGEVMILVWDAVAERPVPREAGPDDVSGRGLALMEALCARWDWYLPSAPPGGKVTRAVIDDPWREAPGGLATRGPGTRVAAGASGAHVPCGTPARRTLRAEISICAEISLPQQ
jgi:hypothetical protein